MIELRLRGKDIVEVGLKVSLSFRFINYVWGLVMR